MPHLCSARVVVSFTSVAFNAGILLGTESGGKSWGKTDFALYLCKSAVYREVLGL